MTRKVKGKTEIFPNSELYIQLSTIDHLSASQAKTIADDFIRKNGEGDKLANMIYRDNKKNRRCCKNFGRSSKAEISLFQ